MIFGRNLDRKFDRAHVLSPNNSGSSFAQHLLVVNNFALLERESQIDLFKHYPFEFHRKVLQSSDNSFSSTLFVIIVREPIAWLNAMQRNPYEFRFDDFESPCHVDLSAHNFGQSYESLLLEKGFDRAYLDKAFSFDNLVRFWGHYYGEAIRFMQDYSSVMITYEELLFRAPECVESLKRLSGRGGEAHLVIPMLPSKEHGDAKGFLGARQSLLNQQKDDFSDLRRLVKKYIEPDLLNKLGYDQFSSQELDKTTLEKRLARHNLFWGRVFGRFVGGRLSEQLDVHI